MSAEIQIPATTSEEVVATKIIHERLSHVVQVKRSWGDAWTEYPYLHCIFSIDNVAPKMPQARFAWNYGRIKREDTAAVEFNFPIALSDVYVRVVDYEDGNAEPTGMWYGFIPSGTDSINAPYSNGDQTRATSGDQEWQAYGLEFLLDRTGLYGPVVFVDNFESSEIKTVNTPMIFNSYGVPGQENFGNRSILIAPAIGSKLFSAEGEVWSNLDIINYILANHIDADLKDSGFAPQLAGNFKLLDTLASVVMAEGKTIKAMLDHLVSRMRGVFYTVKVVDDKSIQIFIDTVFPETIVTSTGYIPGNSNRTDLDVSDNKMIESVQIKELTNIRYDKIIVRGNNTKSIFSMAEADETQEDGWENSVEQTYKDAGDDEESADNARRRDEMRGVYQDFIIPKDFDWKAGDGLGGLKNFIVPAFHKNGQAKKDSNGKSLGENGNFWNRPRAFLRVLPFKLPDAEKFLRPVAFIKSETADGDEVWVQTDELDTLGYSPASLTMFDDALGYRLRSRIGHTFGKNSFDPNDSKTKIQPEVDYKDLICTVGVTTDQRATVISEYPRKNSKGKELVIDINSAEFWYIVPKTVIGVTDNGELMRSTSDDAVIRDDTDVLRDVAVVAGQWYGKDRSVVDLKAVGRSFEQLSPGVLITSVEFGGGRLPKQVNTVVTERRVDYGQINQQSAPRVSVKTAFTELDIARLFDVPGNSDERGLARTLENMKRDTKEIYERIGDVPVRDPVDYSGPTSFAAIAKTDSSGGSVTIKRVKSDAEEVGEEFDVFVLE